MSHIDQAFIKAYGAEETTSNSTGQAALHSTWQAPGEVNRQHEVYSGSHLPEGQTPQPPHFVVNTPMASKVADAPNLPTRQPLSSFTSHQNLSPAATGQEKRPLSSFSAPEAPSANAFRPMLEVDAFQWPQVISDLLQSHAPLLIPLAEQLAVASESGRSMIGIAGARAGVGVSTVLLCFARMLASVEKSVAIVDANFASHSLAQHLGLEVDTGWEEVLAGQIPLAEGVIHSINDNISLLPLVGRNPRAVELLAGIQASISAGVLRYHYDVVLFDLGDISQQPQHDAAQRLFEQCRIDSSIFVADAVHTSPAVSENIEPLMAMLGATCLGVIGNSAA